MAERDGPRDVRGVVDRVEQAGADDEVKVAEVVDAIGAGAFGPLLLVPALILVTPISSIPGMPSVGSLIISLVAIQIAIGRRSLWLPGFLRHRTISKERLVRSMGYLHRPARVIDRLTRRRLVFLTRWPFLTVPALVCSVMVVFAPAFETVPFSVSIVACGVAFFAVALVTEDGLLVPIGFLFIAAWVYLAWNVFG